MIIEGEIFEIKFIEQHRIHFPRTTLFQNIIKNFPLFYQTKEFKIQLNEDKESFLFIASFSISDSKEFKEIETILRKLDKKNLNEVKAIYQRLINNQIGSFSKKGRAISQYVYHLLYLKKSVKNYRQFNYSFNFNPQTNNVTCLMQIPQNETRQLVDKSSSLFSRRYSIDSHYEFDEIHCIINEYEDVFADPVINRGLAIRTFKCLVEVLELIAEENTKSKRYYLSIDIQPLDETFLVEVVTDKLETVTLLKLNKRFLELNNSPLIDRRDIFKKSVKDPTWNNKLDIHLLNIFGFTTIPNSITTDKKNNQTELQLRIRNRKHTQSSR